MRFLRRHYLWLGVMALMLSVAILWLLKTYSSNSQVQGFAYVQSRTAYFSAQLNSELNNGQQLTPTLVSELLSHLATLREGITRLDPDGLNIHLDPITDPSLRALIADAEVLLSRPSQARDDRLVRASFNAFALASENYFSERAQTKERNRFQVLSAALLGLLLICLFACWRLRRAERLADSAAQKTRALISSMVDGAVVLDKEGTVVAQNAQVTHRNVLPGICIGSHFLNFLAPMLSEREIKSLRQAIFALHESPVGLDPESRARELIVELNARSAQKPTVYLDLKLSQCEWFKDAGLNDYSHILVVIGDASESIETQKTLEATMRLQKTRPKQLVDALYASPSEVRRFLARSKMIEHDIRNVLSSQEQISTSAGNPLRSISRLMSTALEDAKAIKIELFMDAWTEFALIHQKSKEKKILDERSLMRMLAKLDDIHMLRKLLNAMMPMMTTASAYRAQYGDESLSTDLTAIEQMSHELVGAYSAFSESVSVEDSFSSGAGSTSTEMRRGKSKSTATTAKQTIAKSETQAELASDASLVELYTSFAQGVAVREGKKIEIFFKGMSLIDASHPNFKLLVKAGNQLLRNSIEHGLEIELDRMLKHKKRHGRIDVDLLEEDYQLCLSVRDDGRGLDFPNIQKRAIELGLIDVQKDRIDKRSLLRFIFQDGFSAHEETEDKIFHGAGLSRVKAAVKALGGKVTVSSGDGQYCQFKIKLPNP